jgi:hypothetical protein
VLHIFSTFSRFNLPNILFIKLIINYKNRCVLIGFGTEVRATILRKSKKHLRSSLDLIVTKKIKIHALRNPLTKKASLI